jgi:hypothetical protein
VPLFLDRLPFRRWTDNTRTPPREHWSVVLPVLLTEPGLTAPPTNASLHEWVFDTGTRGEAFAWRQHILAAGLNPDADRLPSPVRVTSAAGGKETLPVCAADLWLISNLSAPPAPWHMELLPGPPFRDVPALPDPEFHRPLVGMRALLRARLRVELDFDGKTLSLWTPDDAGAPSPTAAPG